MNSFHKSGKRRKPENSKSFFFGCQVSNGRFEKGNDRKSFWANSVKTSADKFMESLDKENLDLFCSREGNEENGRIDDENKPNYQD